LPATFCRHVIGAIRVRSRFNPNGSEDEKRVSARHQVKRPGSNFKRRSRFQKPVRQKKQAFFVRCGSHEVRNFTGRNSGRWDLVLTCSPTPSFSRSSLLPAFPFPKSFAVAADDRDLLADGKPLRGWLSGCDGAG
jgi:hypothetical protein